MSQFRAPTHLPIAPRLDSKLNEPSSRSLPIAPRLDSKLNEPSSSRAIVPLRHGLDLKINTRPSGNRLYSKPPVSKAAAAKKAESSSDDSDSDSDSSDDKPAAKKPAAKSTKSEEAASSGDEHKIYVEGLPWTASEAGVSEFFKACGKIVSVECPLGEDGRSSGTAFVKFSKRSELEAALELNGQLWPGTERWLKIFEKSDRKTMSSGGVRPEGCDTVFVGNLPWDVKENQLRELFAPAGEVSLVRFGYEDGSFKGFGHVSFYEGGHTDAAVGLSGCDVNGRAIRVDYAPPRVKNQKILKSRDRGVSSSSSVKQLNPNMSQLNPDLSQLNPNLAQLNPNLAQLNPHLSRDRGSSISSSGKREQKDKSSSSEHPRKIPKSTPMLDLHLISLKVFHTIRT